MTAPGCKGVEAGDPPQVVTDTIVMAATAFNPTLRYSAGKPSSQVRALHGFMPERWGNSTLRKFNEFPSEQV
jgi:hypothetical protein